ncbi:hypothetical protein MPH_13979, partial [Macrophomina phaseolina MS6]
MRFILAIFFLLTSINGALCDTLEDHNYRVQKDNKGRWNVYSQYYQGGNAPIDQVLINTEQAQFTIYIAQNAAETSNPKKLFFSDILYRLCSEKERIQPTSLKVAVIDDVTEPATVQAMQSFRRSHGLGPRADFNVTPRDSEWQGFLNTPFCKVINRMMGGGNHIAAILGRYESGRQNLYLSIN